MNVCALDVGVSRRSGAMEPGLPDVSRLVLLPSIRRRQLGAHRPWSLPRRHTTDELYHALHVDGNRGQQRLTQHFRQAAIAGATQIMTADQLRQLALDRRMFLAHRAVRCRLGLGLGGAVLGLVVVLDDRPVLRVRVGQTLGAQRAAPALLLGEAELHAGVVGAALIRAGRLARRTGERLAVGTARELLRAETGQLYACAGRLVRWQVRTFRPVP